jgi:hypothetical protein
MIVDSLGALRHASLGSDAWDDGIGFERWATNLS